MTEISAIKVVAPNVLERVVDLAIQMHGAAGLSHDTPLAAFYARWKGIYGERAWALLESRVGRLV